MFKPINKLTKINNIRILSKGHIQASKLKLKSKFIVINNNKFKNKMDKFSSDARIIINSKKTSERIWYQIIKKQILFQDKILDLLT